MNTRRVAGWSVGAVVLGLALAFAAATGAEPHKTTDKPRPNAADQSAKEDANSLSMEADALTTMRQYQLDRSQIEALGKRAVETAAKDDKRQPAKVSDKFHKALAELRDALRAGDDDVDEKADAVDDLRDEEKPEVDDGVELTDAARKQAPEYLALLTPRQLAAYIGDLDEDDLDGPLEKLTAGFAPARKLNGKDWDAARDDTAETVGWLVAGLDAEASAKVAGRAKELLDRAHALKDADYKAQRDELAKEAKSVVGDVGPTDVLRHIVEHPLAELLSNPRLAAAVEGRLKTTK